MGVHSKARFHWGRCPSRLLHRPRALGKELLLGGSSGDFVGSTPMTAFLKHASLLSSRLTSGYPCEPCICLCAPPSGYVYCWVSFVAMENITTRMPRIQGQFPDLSLEEPFRLADAIEGEFLPAGLAPHFQLHIRALPGLGVQAYGLSIGGPKILLEALVTGNGE